MDESRFLIDPYLEWTGREGLPVIEDVGVDLLAVETRPWARTEANGAFVHVSGRGDYLNVIVCEIPPGGATSPQRHLFEEVVYVLEGNGSTVIEGPGGEKHSFEWGPHSLFALPLNARYRHYNGSGSSPARIASVTNLPMMMNAFHSEDFVFDNDYEFPERMGEEEHFRGEGNLVPIRPGKDMWETNFVPDLSAFDQLREWKARGGGGSHIKFILADGTMHAHISEMPVGIYKKGHRHSADYHIFPIVGHGYSLLWYEGDEEWKRIDWKHGWVFAPADQQFHQHFNTSGHPARYLAVAFGNVRYPFSEAKRKGFLGADVNVKQGGGQIDYEDEDPLVRQMFEEELAKNGVESRMDGILAGTRS